MIRLNKNSIAIQKVKLVADEWNFNKNSLNPFLVGKDSTKKIWWICKVYGHEWLTRINHRFHGSNFPVCGRIRVKDCTRNLAYKYPTLAQEWHPTNNTCYLKNSRYLNNKQGDDKY